MSESVLPMFFSRSFIVSGLTETIKIYRSLIHFELIFVNGVRKCFIVSGLTETIKIL